MTFSLMVNFMLEKWCRVEKKKNVYIRSIRFKHNKCKLKHVRYKISVVGLCWGIHALCLPCRIPFEVDELDEKPAGLCSSSSLVVLALREGLSWIKVSESSIPTDRALCA